jgi:tight adherence protein B
VIGGAVAATLVASTVFLFASALGVEERRRFLERMTTMNAGTDDVRRMRPSKRVIVGAAAVGCGCVGALLGGPVVGIAVGVAAAIAPVAMDRKRNAGRRAAIDGQLLDAVTAVASALRSGRSLGQALTTAADEADDPLCTILAGTAHAASLGVPMDEALDRFADAVGGSDVRLVSGVLKVHRRTGGALAASLDDVARTLADRREAARELRSLTAQARLSAAILGLLPLGFFLFMSVVARRDIESAYRTTAGASAIAIGLALQGAAFVWIRRLLRVDEA